MKEPGQIGYEAYCDHTNWKSLATGQALPQWEALRPDIQKAWDAVETAYNVRALAVIRASEGDVDFAIFKINKGGLAAG